MNARDVAVHRPPSGPPRSMSPQLDFALSTAFSALENGKLPAIALPSGARAALENRAKTLDAALGPASREAVLTVIASLAGMPTKAETDPAKVRALLAVEVSDLMASGLPQWALEAAARAYRLGDVGEGRFRPTVGELVTLGRKKAHAHHAERFRIEQVLRAKIELPGKPASPEQRQQVKDGLSALAARMSA